MATKKHIKLPTEAEVKKIVKDFKEASLNMYKALGKVKPNAHRTAFKSLLKKHLLEMGAKL